MKLARAKMIEESGRRLGKRLMTHAWSVTAGRGAGWRVAKWGRSLWEGDDGWLAGSRLWSVCAVRYQTLTDDVYARRRGGDHHPEFARPL